jgi:hypothetical protein
MHAFLQYLYVAYTLGLCNICIKIKCLEFCSKNVFLWTAIISTEIINSFVSVTETQAERICIYCIVWPVFLAHRNIRVSPLSGCNVKANPVQVWTVAEGSRSLKLPDFKTVETWGGNFVSPTHRPPLLPSKYSWYSFQSEAESTSRT